jgi:hypothetical protein
LNELVYDRNDILAVMLILTGQWAMPPWVFFLVFVGLMEIYMDMISLRIYYMYFWRPILCILC